MNHIYRRIWSTARKCWVVASELSSARGKSTGQPTRMAAAAVILASLVVPAASAEDGTEERDEGIPIARQAVERERVHPFVAVLTAAPAMSPPVPMATVKAIHAQLALVSDTSYRDSTISGNDMLVLGSRSSLSSGNRSVGYGNAISSRGENNTAIGHNAEITSGYSTAVGAFSRTSGIGATALGHDARATSSNAIALGSGAQASSSNSVAIGANSVANSSYTVSVGSTSNQRKIVNVARGSTAYGSTDAVTGGQLYETNQDVSSVRSTANSAYSNASSALSTANTAKSNADNALAKANIREGLLNQASVSGNVRIGASNSGTTLDIRNSANVNRKIAGIAAGTVNAASADAVNGSQLYATDQTAKAAKAAADSALAQSTTASYLLANGNTPTVAMRAQATGTGALATGIYTEANGTAAMAVGRTAKAKADGAIALGDRASVGNGTSKNSIAIGTTATTGVQEDLMAIGRNATASGGVGAMALGANSAAGHLRSVALGSGSVTTAQDQVSVGSTSIKRKIINVADATLNSSSTEAVTGRQLNATNTNVSTALSDASLAKANANTALTEVGTLKGLLSQDGASGDVRIGEKNSGTVLDVRNSANANRKLTGVADGVVSASSYEAVNGRQLSATNDKVTTVEGVARSAGEDAAVAKTDAAKALTETAALGGLVAQVSASGDVRLGGKNSGATLDVRNSANANRKISGVADGLLDVGSADAVNGRQLHAVEQSAQGARNIADEAVRRIEDIAESSRYFSSGKGGPQGAARAGLIAVAIGDSAEASVSSEGAVAVGGFSAARGKNSVALGRAARVDELADNGFALGVLASVQEAGGVTVGANSIVQKGATSALSLGASSVADEAYTASFGSDEVKRRLTNVARGTADHNATTLSQLKDSLATLGGGASVDASGNIIAPTYAVQGGTQNTVEDALMALDGAVITAGRRADKVEGQLSSIFQESPSTRADGVSQIALNGVNGMVLTNLADGRVAPGSRDAVTGSQLYAAEQKISQNRNDLEAMRKEREMGEQAMRGLDASVIDYGGARLTGVAEAMLSADSSDVVRGSQLYKTNSRISELEGVAQFVSIGSAPFSERAEAGVAGVAVGNSAKTGLDGGTAVGTFAEAMGKNSTAIGRAAAVSEDSENGFAMGAGAQVGGDAGGAYAGVAIGASASVEGGAHGSLALGNGSLADEEGVASFGGVGIQRRLVNIARGTADHNATTVSQLKDSLATLGGGAGMGANGDIIAPTYAVQGATQNTVEDALMALDGAVITAGRRADKVEGQLSSIFQDSPSARADGMNQIALNGVNGMVLTNLADGRVAPGSRDAVTGSQLYAAEQKISQNRNDLETMRKEREVGEQAMRGLDASGPIDFGGARLTGVAEATLSADSSDVVRGSQLYETNEELQRLASASRFVAVGDLGPGQVAKAGPVGVAIGDSAEASLQSEGAVAIGSFAKAAGKNSVALGRAAYVDATAEHGFSFGVHSSVHEANGIAIGVGSTVKQGAGSSVAIGVHSVADEARTVAFGNGEMKRRLINIANGTANHNAATVGQLRSALSALGSEVDANGNIVDPSFNVQGQSQPTLNGALEALDGAVVSTTSRVNQVESQLRSVFQETPSVRADGTHQLTLAGANGMVISNVANGLIAAGSRDAVNGGQLHSMQQQLNGRMDGLEQRIDDQPQARAMAAASTPSPSTEEIAPASGTSGSPQIASTGEGDKPAPQPKSKQDDTPKPQVDTADLEKMLARANEYTEGAISNFERRLDKMDKRFNRMAAMSSAQTAMAMNTAGLATYNRLGAGVGYSEGESAMAVGYQRVLNEKGSATFSLNGAFTNSGERSMGVGVGIGW